MPYRRKGTKQVWITVNGVRQSSGTEDYSAAKKLEHKLNHENWLADKLGVKFARWEPAAIDWFKRHADQKAISVSRTYAEFWDEHLKGKALNEITGELVRDIMERTRPVNVKVAIPANTTANLYMEFVRKVMRHAGANFKIQTFPKPRGRDQWLSLEQWRSLGMPEDFRQLATFSLATGLREANVMGLQWEWIRGNTILIPAEFTKTAKPYGIPLNRTAITLLQERRSAVVRHARNVFTLDGKEIYRVKVGREWKKTLTQAGVAHMPYHSLRHTYASWMVQAGVPFEIVARLGQWTILHGGMTHRYTHFDVESLRPWAERFDAIITDERMAANG